VLSLARDAGRILLTEDKDFGWLVYVSLERSAGVVLLRYRREARASIVESMVALVTEQPEQLSGSFTVVQPGHVRFSLRP
jgi:predicted nuclease of predicted toxin-antitoxin system